MGEEIDQVRFTEQDFEQYRRRVVAETELLTRWFTEGAFDTGPCTGGFELEAWLIDPELRPAPVNEAFMAAMSSELISPELARFNIELNTEPRKLSGRGLAELEEAMSSHWDDCQAAAAGLDARLLMIGILPTLEPADLSLANMSGLNRYRALNEQVLRQRDGRSLQLDITGREHLRLSRKSVMLESAATSFQIHLKCSPEAATRLLNASTIASGPMVAASANSPYLFGRDLWDETRIPLFEQAVEVGGMAGASGGPLRRVTFGSGYLRSSLLECFVENVEHYPVLLPRLCDEPIEQLPHLRLLNGTIWRWNRPLIGFQDDGRPHLRIEHRVVPGGPSMADAIANAALYYGLVQALAASETAPEESFEFAAARDNFYAAAQRGLDAHQRWLDGESRTASRLLLEILLPLAHQGLRDLRVDPAVIDRYLGIIESRVRSGQNGARWQRRYMARSGADLPTMTEAYAARQRDGTPVHEWDL